MQRIFVTLALVALCLAQNGGLGGLLGGLGGKTFPVPSGSFNGSSSFGLSTTTYLTTITTVAASAGGAATAVTSANAQLGGLTSFASLGLQVSFTVTASVAGTVNVSLVSYTGGSLASFNGFSPAGSASSNGNAGISSYFGFQIYSTLAANTFTITATITPTVAATSPLNQLSANLQLFYAVNATDGSNSVYSNGKAGGNFFGALPSSVVYNGNAVAAVNFTLPPVQFANVVAANVDLSIGYSAATPAIFPVLYNTTAKVLAGAQALYVFSTQFALALYNAANTTITATYNTAYNTPITITAGAAASYSGSATVGGFTYNSSNTAYAGVSYNISVASQTQLAATLVRNTSNAGLNALQAGWRYVWAYYNETTGAAQILTDSVYSSASATVSVNVTHFSTYAVYQTNDQNSTPSGSSSSSAASTTSQNPSGNAGVPSTTAKPTGSASAMVVGILAVIAAVALSF